MDRIKNIINGSTKKDKYKIRDRFRHLFQSIWFLITNSYFEGFKTGKIYGGNLKKICVPGMNCYSCVLEWKGRRRLSNGTWVDKLS